MDAALRIKAAALVTAVIAGAAALPRGTATAPTTTPATRKGPLAHLPAKPGPHVEQDGGTERRVQGVECRRVAQAPLQLQGTDLVYRDHAEVSAQILEDALDCPGQSSNVESVGALGNRGIGVGRDRINIRGVGRQQTSLQ